MESKRLVLAELHRLLDEQLRASETLTSKALGVLNATGIAWVIIGTLGLLQRHEMFAPPWLWVWILTVVGYMAMVGIVVGGILPQDYSYPITTDWDELHRLFILKDEDACLDQLLSNYTTYIDLNRQPLQRQRSLLKPAALILPVIVALLTILAATR